MLSRLEEGGKIIMIATRWSSLDLSGVVLNWCKEGQKKYRHINLQAVTDWDEKTVLCDKVLSYESAVEKMEVMGKNIFMANYQQIPIDEEGRLYREFKTYNKMPVDSSGFALFDGVYSYCDTADEGTDYLCNFIWGDYQGKAYILDIIYTQEPMTVTEDKVAEALTEYSVSKARIESNNGGSSFARNVQRKLKEKGNIRTRVTWFHQSKNKEARILSNSPWIENNVYYPKDWDIRWREYSDHIRRFQRDIKGNAHDDAPDALTGVAETMFLIHRC
jgi:phage uncharacterized protein (putative large terminase), C-terminal domain